MPSRWPRNGRRTASQSSSRSSGRVSSSTRSQHSFLPAPPSAPRRRRTPVSNPVRLHSVPVSDLNSILEDNENAEDGAADENADYLQEIVMAVEIKERGTVGCAYYVAQEEKLYCIEQIKFGNVEIVDSRP